MISREREKDTRATVILAKTTNVTVRGCRHRVEYKASGVNFKRILYKCVFEVDFLSTGLRDILLWLPSVCVCGGGGRYRKYVLTN